jgi:tetratricopeptide (TPR) repeat protein
MPDGDLLPGIAEAIVAKLESFAFADALKELDDPRRGGALRPAIAGLLRSRALSGLERWHASYGVLGDVRGLKDLTTLERLEAQVRTARVLRFASPLVDYALDIALAAAMSGARAGDAGIAFAVEARIEAALLYGRKRCKALAEGELDRATALGKHPGRVWIARGDLALTFDDRVRAKEAFAKALAIATDDLGEWQARLGLARLHTVLGEFDDAAVELGKLGPRAKGDVSARRVKWRLLASQAKWREVAEVLGEILDAAPDGDPARNLMLERASALYRAGDLDAARMAWTKTAASGNGDFASQRAARMLERSARVGERRARLVAFPSVTQLRDHCGPASVELCLRFFGTSADQVAVARAIKHPDGGTPVHKMRAYMDAAGFLTRRVEAELPTLKKIIDAGVPVIVEEDYSTSRHVAVAIGYDDAREILEIQDPMTHEIRETPYEELPKLREFSNHGALVAVPQERKDLVAKLDAAGAVECAYMSTTDRGWEAYDREENEKADALASEAIALHEPYELAWVLRFNRAKDDFLKESTDEKKDTLLGVLNRILALWPDDEWPQQFLGRVYAIENRPQDALEAFEKARDRDPDDANNWSSIGDQHLELGNRADARKAFEEALRRDPGHVRANENLANVAFEAGDVSLGAMLNACARELNPTNPYNRWVHARILARAGDLDGAIGAYERALELRKGFGPYVVERAKLLAKKGNVDDALASIAKLLEANDKDTYLIVNYADLAYEHRRLDACIGACEKLRAIDPKTPTPDAIQGAALWAKGDVEAARKMLAAALVKRPTYAWVQRETGRALAREGKHQEAIAAFAAASGLSTGAELVWYLADALATAGYPADASSYARRAAESGALDEEQLLRCAIILKDGEGPSAAHRFFGTLGENPPRDIGIARAHVRLLLEVMWAPGAVQAVLSRLSELAPEDPFVQAIDADCLMDASERDEPHGEELFAKAIAKAPSLAAPRRLYAKQLVSRGRYAEALATLEPLDDHADTVEDRVKALLGLRKDDEARAAIDAFAAAQPEDVRAARRRKLDYTVAKVERRWEEAAALTEAIAADEGELEDDGELGHWETERFHCLVELGRADEAYAFGIAQCADASDKGRLAYEALNAGDLALAKRLADLASEEDEDDEYAITVLARLADHDGDVARAKGLWTRMKELSTWHVHHENLARLALTEGDLDTARSEIERAIATGHTCPVALEIRAQVRLLGGDRTGAEADAKRARACVAVDYRDRSEELEALVAALAGDREEARSLFVRYIEREKLSPSDRARYAKVRETLSV